MSDHSTPSERPSKRLAHPVVWLSAILGLVALRTVGRAGVFVQFRDWAGDLGVPGWMLGYESQLSLVLIGAVLWVLMRCLARENSTWIVGDLGLGRGFYRGLVVGGVICLPMLSMGVIVGRVQFELSMVKLAIMAPFAEEFLFRGVLVLAMVRLMGTSFWLAAIVGGVLFGVVHVNPWSAAGFAGDWPSLLVTGTGGVWYAWLAQRWGRNLWVVVTAHALMNLAWTWYDGASGAFSGQAAAETGRALSIALGTTMTIRPDWFRMGWAQMDRPVSPPPVD